MADIFVSYKAEDRARVRPLVDALQADGLDVWWDAHISGGEDWRESIAANLDKARCVIVIWSKRSVGPEGRFVRDEAARAMKRTAYLPVTIDKVDPPLGFGETQCLPLAGWKGNREDPRYLALLDAARHAGSGAPTVRGSALVSTGNRPGIDRRALLTAGGVAGVAAAGGLGWLFLRGAPANANSVAVLPFANLSGDPGQAYFSDGMAEEVRSALSRIAGLKVIGRTSSELLRNDDVPEVARRLDVGSLVTGSVRRSPSTIRVSAQLVDGRNGVEKWSQTFDRPNGDVLQIQTNIAEAVAQQLRSQLGAVDRAAITLGGTQNAAAQDLVLKADANLDGSKEALQSQLALYDAALALDPNYATALARKSLAETHIVSYYGQSIVELNRGLAQGEATARKAIALAPDLADAHYALGTNRQNVLDFATCWAEYQRAFASPGCPPRFKLLVARFASQIGGAAEAGRLLRSVADNDPLNPDLVVARAGLAVDERRYGEAIPLFEQFLTKKPTSTAARSGLTMALVARGRFGEALQSADRLPHEHPNYSVARSVVAARSGDRAKATAILGEMRATTGVNGAYQYAEMLAQIGDREGAVAELQSAFKYRDPGLPYFPTDFTLDPIRGNPRVKAIVAQLNFPKI